ncbi:hypothetical protein Tco_0993564 [Tanacetum coccineum]
MDDPNITMKEYIRLEEEKARRRGQVYNWETATYGKILDNEDVFTSSDSVEEIPEAIVFYVTLTYESQHSRSVAYGLRSLINVKLIFEYSLTNLSMKIATVLFLT